MRTRTAFGLTWALVAGVAGGWLVLSPWALGVQAGGDWSQVTRSEVGGGLGLILLAVIGLGLVMADLVGLIRTAGRGPRRQSEDPATSPEMEQALLELAQSLARDLAEGRPPAREPVPAFASRGEA